MDDDLNYKSEPVVQLRIGEEPVHECKTATARRRRGLIRAGLLAFAIFNTSHGDPLPPAQRGCGPPRFRERGAIVASQQPLGLLSPRVQTPLGKSGPCSRPVRIDVAAGKLRRGSTGPAEEADEHQRDRAPFRDVSSTVS